MKTQMDLLTKCLLSDSVEKMKEIGSRSREIKSNFDEEVNNLNNQGGFLAND